MSLKVDSLTKAFGEKTAVDHISFTMDAPGVFGLIGTNGAGKTTTIRMILGIMSADSGSLERKADFQRNAGIRLYARRTRHLYEKQGTGTACVFRDAAGDERNGRKEARPAADGTSGRYGI